MLPSLGKAIKEVKEMKERDNVIKKKIRIKEELVRKLQHDEP